MLTRTDRRRFPVLLAVIAALAMAMLFSPVQAQEGSAPDKPRGLEATATHGQVVLTWDDPQDDSITGYVILRRVRVNDTGGDFSVLVSDTGTAALTYTDDTVAASLTYTYRIKAINEHGVSERSRWFHVDTPAAPEPEEEQAAEPPDKPRGLEATATHDSVTLTWDDPGDDSITGYVILRRVRVNDTGGDFDVLVANTETAALTYTDDTVAASTTYTYRIKAINEHGVSERSRWSHINVPAAPEPEEEQAAEPPDKPRGLEATATHDSVTLTWDDPQDDSITGYVILRRIPGVDPEGHFNELVSNTGTDATTYTDDTVAAETRYTYRIKAINEHGVSERSRWFHINVPAAPEAAEGDEQDGEGGGGSGGPGKRANVSEGGTDCSGDTATTCEVDVGGSVTGNIGFLGDGDYFRVDLEAGTRYQIDLEGADTGRGTLADPALVLYDESDSYLLGDDNNGVGDNARMIYTPTTAGTYYLFVEDSLESVTGTYTLSVIVLGANGASEADTDFPATTATTGRVDVGASATGNIDRSFDQDWFRLDLEAGKTYQIDLEGDTGGGGTLGDPYLRNIRDSSGTEISGTENDDIVGGVADSRVVFTPTADGAYYLVASGFDGTYTGTYTLSVTELETRTEEGDTDFASDVTTLGRVEVGGSATGEIENVADGDWFRVVLEKDKTYVFDLEGTETSSGTLADPILLLSDASGSTLEGDDDGGDGANSRLEYTATADGIHYLTATTPTSATSGGTYTLSVREVTTPSTPGFGEGVADLLSNLGQGTDINSFAGIGTYDSAQGFTTGRERNGYFLDSITLDVKTVPNTPADVTVELWFASSGNPDASIATLKHATGNWATGLNTFHAPPGKVLAAKTKYFVVVSYSGGRPGLDLEVTRTLSADDASTNWTVTGKRLERQSGNGGSWAGVSATEHLKFRVRAAAVPGQVPAEGDTDLPANATTNGVLVADGYAARAAIAEPVFVERTGDDDVDGYTFDTDWLAVDLKAGRTYRIDMKGATPGDDELTLRLPEIEAIYDADSNYLPNTSSRDATDHANSSHHLARVEFTPDADGTYYIAATGESFTWGVYELTVIDITEDADEHPADRSTTEHAQRGTPVTGKIDFSGDVDWFRLNKTVADTYQIDLEGQATGRGSLRDPLLRGVYDADGNYISGTRNEDGGEGYNARITLDLPVGIYYIAVGAFGNHEGTYTLSVNYS